MIYHKRRNLEVSWVSTATPETHKGLDSVHSQMLEVLGGKVLKTRPQLTTLCFSSALLPLYVRFFASLVRGGPSGALGAASPDSLLKVDPEKIDELLMKGLF